MLSLDENIEVLQPIISASRIFEVADGTDMPVRILLVEDNESDAVMMRLTLDAMGICYSMEQLKTGAEVVPYLKQEGAFADKPKPDLILLDLGLPDRDGFEILAELSAMHTPQQHAPIAILTGHEHLDYLKKCYDLQIADYVVKPCSTEKLQSLLTRTYH